MRRSTRSGAKKRRSLKRDGYEEVLKHSRWCLLKRRENLTDQQTVKLTELLKYNLQSVRSHLLREDFQRFWEYVSPAWAGKFLDQWCTRTMRSKIEPMKAVARSLREHRHLLLNWFLARGMVSAGSVEGLNNKAKVTTRKSYGFRVYKVIEIALYHALGKLPEPKFTANSVEEAFSRRWGLFDEESAWRSRPASDLCGRDASRCGHLRSNAAEAIQEQTRTEGEKGPRLPNPKEAMKKAEHNRSGRGPWVWQTVKATAYGVTRKLRVVSFQAVWPEVRGLRPILVVLVRDPRGKFQDKYLFTTDLNADLGWIIAAFSRRWSIEVAFKSSKQVMKIQSPQHWCQKSVETLSPWVWLMQSVIGLWYFTEGRKLPVAQAAHRRFGKWDTEWSLAHMLRILRAAILEATINPESATKADLCQLFEALENYLNLAA